MSIFIYYFLLNAYLKRLWKSYTSVTANIDVILVIQNFCPQKVVTIFWMLTAQLEVVKFSQTWPSLGNPDLN